MQVSSGPKRCAAIEAPCTRLHSRKNCRRSHSSPTPLLSFHRSEGAAFQTSQLSGQIIADTHIAM
ncbi:hypothetical protein EYF80_026114 [Liparis tanakae]|uniref:Uncharacterized protein n=1 Tax=Liparis tanakae TaxID=230148 RepID=A0A4Z2HDA5_9TELE|nr:hypothetical protein EYF80_026114 [Liparis tanakae]